MKKIVTLLVLLIFSWCWCLAEDLWYNINSYNIDYDIKKDWSINVTEKLQIHYNEESHWFFREIPFIYEYDDNYVIETTLSNISVEWDSFQKSVKWNFTILKIGSSDKTILWDKDYIIKYTIDWAIRSYSWRQELFRNLIWTDWDTSTNNAKFIIHFPSDLEVQEYYAQKWKIDRWENIELLYSWNTISNMEWLKLYAMEWVTVALKFPNKFFPVKEKIYKKSLRRKLMNHLDTEEKLYNFAYIVYWILVVLFFVLMRFTYKYSKSREEIFLKQRGDWMDSVRDVIYYDPPEWYTPWEVAIMKEMKSTTRIFATMLYMWLWKWLVTVITKNKRIYFQKIAEPEEKWYKFYKYNNGKYFNSPENEFWNFCFEKDNLYYPASTLPLEKSNRLKKIADTIYYSIIERFCPKTPKFVVNKWALVWKEIKNWNEYTWFTVFFLNFILFIFMLDFWFWFYSCIPLGIIFFYVFISKLFKSIKLYFIEKNLNDEAKVVLEHIRWLKKYLLEVEDEKLNRLTEHNLNYFEDILPYAIALWIWDKWIKKMFSYSEYEKLSGTKGNLDLSGTLKILEILKSVDYEKVLKKSYTVWTIVQKTREERRFYNSDTWWWRKSRSSSSASSNSSKKSSSRDWFFWNSSWNSNSNSSGWWFKLGSFSWKWWGWWGWKRW